MTRASDADVQMSSIPEHPLMGLDSIDEISEARGRTLPSKTSKAEINNLVASLPRASLPTGQAPSLVIAGKATTTIGELKAKTEESSEALASCLTLLPKLSTQGLSVLVSAAQTLLIPAGISSRISTQSALGTRAGSSMMIPTPKAGPKAMNRPSAQQAPKQEKSKWRSLTKPQVQQAQNNPVLALLVGANAKLHGGLTSAEKADLSVLTAETYVGLPDGPDKELFRSIGLGRSKIWSVQEGLAAGILAGDRVEDDTLQKLADSVTEPHFREVLPYTELRRLVDRNSKFLCLVDEMLTLSTGVKIDVSKAKSILIKGAGKGGKDRAPSQKRDVSPSASRAAPPNKIKKAGSIQVPFGSD